MRLHLALTTAVALAASLSFAACGGGADDEPTNPSSPASDGPTASRAGGASSSRERMVLAALEDYKQAILDRDTAELARIWTDNYTFVNPQGGLVTREERLANLGSGNTNVQVIDNEREITVRFFGNVAVVQNLSTLRGRFSGQPTDTDLRGTFVWVRRDGRWRLITNQLTAVSP